MHAIDSLSGLSPIQDREPEGLFLSFLGKSREKGMKEKHMKKS